MLEVLARKCVIRGVHGDDCESRVWLLDIGDDGGKAGGMSLATVG